MAHNVKIEFAKTYATAAGAEKAAQKIYGNNNELRFMIVPVLPVEDGGQEWRANKTGKVRFGILFIGFTALQAMVHNNFNVVA